MGLQLPITSDGEIIDQEAWSVRNLGPKSPGPEKESPSCSHFLSPSPALSVRAADITSLGCGDPIGSHFSLA